MPRHLNVLHFSSYRAREYSYVGPINVITQFLQCIGVQYGRLGSSESKDVYLRIGSFINLPSRARRTIDRAQGKSRSEQNPERRYEPRKGSDDCSLLQWDKSAFDGNRSRDSPPAPRIFLKEIHPAAPACCDQAFASFTRKIFTQPHVVRPHVPEVRIYAKRKSWPVRGNRQ